jgi:hypothetical protein
VGMALLVWVMELLLVVRKVQPYDEKILKL